MKYPLYWTIALKYIMKELKKFDIVKFQSQCYGITSPAIFYLVKELLDDCPVLLQLSDDTSYGERVDHLPYSVLKKVGHIDSLHLCNGKLPKNAHKHVIGLT